MRRDAAQQDEPRCGHCDADHRNDAHTERAHEPMDLGVFTHCGIDPKRKRYIMLKSRIHYRAGFNPIAAHIVECAGAGVTNADLSVYRYRKLTRPIFPLDPI